MRDCCLSAFSRLKPTTPEICCRRLLEASSMRHGIFPMVFAIVLAGSSAVAAGKGRSGGGGQGHGARSHGSSAHPSGASRPHTQGFSAPKPRAQSAAGPSATAQPNHALTTPGTVGAGSSVGGTLPNAFSSSTSAPAAAGTTAQKPMTAAATSLLPAMMYGSTVPFGSSPGLALYHGYHASRNSYGYGRGNRGYG
jgi:hypothetical protein